VVESHAGASESGERLTPRAEQNLLKNSPFLLFSGLVCGSSVFKGDSREHGFVEASGPTASTSEIVRS
jgi:hypothetical protein